MKKKHKNNGSIPKGIEVINQLTEAEFEREFDRSLNEIGINRTTPIQRHFFKNDDDISFDQIVADIEKAQSLKFSYRFTVTPLATPKFVSVKSMSDISDKEGMALIFVDPYESSFKQFLPYSGIFVLNEMIVVANETEDETAKLMIQLCHKIWERGSFKPYVKEVA